ENDSTPWRYLFDYTISPLKQRGVGTVTNDNLGKDKTLGPRGSSVKVDKADAVIQLSRTDNGVKLTTTHRRTAAFPAEQVLVMRGVDEAEPISYRHSESAWPAGTSQKAAELDE